MEFTTKVVPELAKLRTDCLIVPLKQGASLTGQAKAVDNLTGGLIKNLLSRGDICAETGKSLLIPSLEGLPAKRVLLMGIGNSKLTAGEFLSYITNALAAVKGSPAGDVSFLLDDISVNDQDLAWQSQQLALLAESASYCYTTTKASKTINKFKKITIATSKNNALTTIRKSLKIGKAMGIGMNTAKQLGNLPANICTPSYLASQTKSLARKHKSLTAKVIDEKQMKTLGMNALLSVTAGTKEPAKLIILEYKGAAKTTKPQVLVGKGITFDSGGISLKPGAKMDEMKFDMCGAAGVIGTMASIAELGLKINVVAIIAAAENLPSGMATKPGDVVTSMSGQTIEILNTDAEGRLVLCDALTFAERYKPEAVIDVATLTGAVIVALGNQATALYSNQDKLAKQLLEAGQYSYDRAWQMPLWDEYQKQLESPYADIPNIGSPGAGSIIAACFLSRFAKKYDWAHLDVAGTAFQGGGKGASGRPVPMLTQYLINKAAK